MGKLTQSELQGSSNAKIRMAINVYTCFLIGYNN